ncbi:MAG: DUF3160 domain-containing protein [Thermodesulfobacteriota bacterium]|nr:DUF3160 domain-containing protein [Thermodesulfobacteriota bacterium]
MNKGKLKRFNSTIITLFLIIFIACINTSAGVVEKIGIPENLEALEGIYSLEEPAKKKLFEQGFVVLEDEDESFISDAYSKIAYKGVSVFITTDAMLNIFHVVHDDLLMTMEKEHLFDLLFSLVMDITGKAEDFHDTVSLPDLKEAAWENVLIFSVAARLLDESYPIASYVEDEANAYIQKIINHNVTEFYPGDDYTQYKPRGHYEGDAKLESYFRCMKWLSRRIFRIEDKYFPEDALKELRQAVIVAKMLNDDPDMKTYWEKLYRVTSLMAGVADSITPPQVLEAAEAVFGPDFVLDILEDDIEVAKLQGEFRKDKYPTSRIIPVPLQYPDQIPNKYIQFMGERWVADGYVFQQTTFPHVSERLLPMGLDVMEALLSSKRAGELLKKEKQDYNGLEEQLEKLKLEFSHWSGSEWKKSVYNNWLYCLKPLLADTRGNEAYPLFMQKDSWLDEKLNTSLSSWTQLRHDYIMYAKPTYVPCLAGRGEGFVEPIPEFYMELSSLCTKLLTELEKEGVLPAAHKRCLDTLVNYLDIFGAYAGKELQGTALSEEEQSAINGFGISLLSFFGEEGGIGDEKPTLVADVCTDSNTKRVLHEGVGRLNPIVIIYKEPGGETLAGVGFVMSYYEFIEEDWYRLSDSEWEDRVEKDELPPRPWWTESFLSHPGGTLLPEILSIYPPSGVMDTHVTIYGKNFGEEGTVIFGEEKAEILSWTDEKIVVKAPSIIIILIYPPPEVNIPVKVINKQGESQGVNFTYNSNKGSISINRGEVFTSKRPAVICIIPGKASYIRFSNNGHLWSPWQKVKPQKLWLLSKGLGEKRVWAEFWGEEGIYTSSDTIILESF